MDYFFIICNKFTSYFKEGNPIIETYHDYKSPKKLNKRIGQTIYKIKKEQVSSIHWDEG